MHKERETIHLRLADEIIEAFKRAYADLGGEQAPPMIARQINNELLTVVEDLAAGARIADQVMDHPSIIGH